MGRLDYAPTFVGLSIFMLRSFCLCHCQLDKCKMTTCFFADQFFLWTLLQFLEGSFR